jgi:hypothetical protein
MLLTCPAELQLQILNLLDARSVRDLLKAMPELRTLFIAYEKTLLPKIIDNSLADEYVKVFLRICLYAKTNHSWCDATSSLHLLDKLHRQAPPQGICYNIDVVLETAAEAEELVEACYEAALDRLEYTIPSLSKPRVVYKSVKDLSFWPLGELRADPAVPPGMENAFITEVVQQPMREIIPLTDTERARFQRATYHLSFMTELYFGSKGKIQAWSGTAPVPSWLRDPRNSRIIGRFDPMDYISALTGCEILEVVSAAGLLSDSRSRAIALSPKIKEAVNYLLQHIEDDIHILWRSINAVTKKYTLPFCGTRAAARSPGISLLQDMNFREARKLCTWSGSWCGVLGRSATLSVGVPRVG